MSLLNVLVARRALRNCELLSVGGEELFHRWPRPGMSLNSSRVALSRLVVFGRTVSAKKEQLSGVLTTTRNVATLALARLSGYSRMILKYIQGISWWIVLRCVAFCLALCSTSYCCVWLRFCSLLNQLNYCTVLCFLIDVWITVSNVLDCVMKLLVSCMKRTMWSSDEFNKKSH